jgi:hypothetical protein
VLIDARASVMAHIRRLLLPVSVVIRALNSPLANFDCLWGLDNTLVCFVRLSLPVQVVAALINHAVLASHWIIAITVLEVCMIKQDVL